MRQWSGVVRAFLAVTLFVGATGCGIGDDDRVRDRALLAGGAFPQQLVLPDTVFRNVTFTVSYVAFARCLQPFAGETAATDGLSATVVSYVWRDPNETSCPGTLTASARSVSLVFSDVGTATISIEGSDTTLTRGVQVVALGAH